MFDVPNNCFVGSELLDVVRELFEIGNKVAESTAISTNILLFSLKTTELG